MLIASFDLNHGTCLRIYTYLNGVTVCINNRPLPNSNTLRIEDDGPGIPDRERETVFKRFYRTASTSTTKGSGPGLAITK